MPCSTLEHLLAISINHLSTHILSSPSTHHNPYPLKRSTVGSLFGGDYQSHYPVGTSNRAHQEELTFYLIATLVLGLSWLETHNPMLDWSNHSITFPTRPIPTRSRHYLDSVVVESGLVATLAIVSVNVTILVSNLPVRYNDFFDIFEKWNSAWLPAHCPYECQIELQASKHPPLGPIYGFIRTRT